MQLIQRINQVPVPLREKLGYILDCLRVVIGVVLLVKAISFIGNKEYLVGLFAESKDLWFVPAMLSHYVILAHLAGGICLIVGLLTRIAALCQVPILLGAVFYVHLPKIMYTGEPQNLEYAILVLLSLVVILIHGGGTLSVDHLVFDSKDEKPQ
jgi:putative oxidoreductase